jgi:hypothetical protein
MKTNVLGRVKNLRLAASKPLLERNRVRHILETYQHNMLNAINIKS